MQSLMASGETQDPKQHLPGTNGVVHLRLRGACAGRTPGPCQGSAVVGNGVAGAGRRMESESNLISLLIPPPLPPPKSRDLWSMTVVESQKPPERLPWTHTPTEGKGSVVRNSRSRQCVPGGALNAPGSAAAVLDRGQGCGW